MIDPIYHKHLLINAKINNPIRTTEQGIKFLKNLVFDIEMKIIQGPFASYVEKNGNRGLTAIVMIETSHIAFHIWDEKDPGLLQFDLYTCGTLDTNKVLDSINASFEVSSMDWILFDREDGFVIEDQSNKG